MAEFRVGEYVSVEPDFSNDDFEPFVGQVVEVDAPGDPNPIYYVKDDNGDVQPWMSGNLNPTEVVRVCNCCGHEHKPGLCHNMYCLCDNDDANDFHEEIN